MTRPLFIWMNRYFQLVAWVLFIGEPLYKNLNRLEFWQFPTIGRFLFVHGAFIAFFYIIYLYLIPILLPKKGNATFLLYSLILSLVTFSLANLPYWLIGKTFFGDDGISIAFIVPIIQIYAAAVAWRLLIDLVDIRLREKKLRQEKSNADLKFLRSQINPHFLFNTLNNINSLIRSNPSKAERSVVKLSAIMRYMLKIPENKTISLGDEISYIENYLELQRLRLAESFKMDYSVECDDDSLTIEPLLLISFIENCFKHGVHGDKEDFISIKIKIENRILSLQTENRISEDSSQREIESGIGLKNVKSRLELCFPNSFSLVTETANEIYSTQLVITL